MANNIQLPPEGQKLAQVRAQQKMPPRAGLAGGRGQMAGARTGDAGGKVDMQILTTGKAQDIFKALLGAFGGDKMKALQYLANYIQKQGKNLPNAQEIIKVVNLFKQAMGVK